MWQNEAVLKTMTKILYEMFSIDIMCCWQSWRELKLQI